MKPSYNSQGFHPLLAPPTVFILLLNSLSICCTVEFFPRALTARWPCCVDVLSVTLLVLPTADSFCARSSTVHGCCLFALYVCTCTCLMGSVTCACTCMSRCVEVTGRCLVYFCLSPPYFLRRSLSLKLELNLPRMANQ